MATGPGGVLLRSAHLTTSPLRDETRAPEGFLGLPAHAIVA